MKRKRSLSVIESNRPVLSFIQSIKTEHPLWGYRRAFAYLYYRQGLMVNKKRIYRLMKGNGLLMTKINKYKAKRKISRPKPKACYPKHIWGTDMTKIKIDCWGWYYLVLVLDWYTKKIVGYSLSLQSKSNQWQDALNQAVDHFFPKGIKDSRIRPLYLVSDNGRQPTSLSYMKACAVLAIKQIFTSWSKPKGNADTERVIRTLKEDLIWPHDWDNPFTFQRALVKWVDNYNHDFPHQTLGCLIPVKYYQKYVKNNELVLT